MIQKLKIGVFFGGISKEREQSFRWVKSILPHLDLQLFEPILLFVDSLGNIIHVEESILEEESIRRFYPSRNLNRGYRIYIEHLGQLNETQLYKLIYKIGKQVKLEHLSSQIDFGLLALQGSVKESGQLQGILDWLQIPYSGPSQLGASIQSDRAFLHGIFQASTYSDKKYQTITYSEWTEADKGKVFQDIINQIGFPFIISPASQGFEKNHVIIKKRSLEEFVRAVQKCFQEVTIYQKDWKKASAKQRKNAIERLINIEYGIGLPALMPTQELIEHPADLASYLNEYFKTPTHEYITIRSYKIENQLFVESFTIGQEFICAVMSDMNEKTVALPPIEISTESESGLAIEAPLLLASEETIRQIRGMATTLFQKTQQDFLSFFRGYVTPDKRIVFQEIYPQPLLTHLSLTKKILSLFGFTPQDLFTAQVVFGTASKKKNGGALPIYEQLLSRLQIAITTNKQAEKTKVGVLFEENTTQYLQASRWFEAIQKKESGQIEPIAICLAANGFMFQIPSQWMNFDSFEELAYILSKKNAPEIEDLKIQLLSILNTVSQSMDLDITKWEEQNIIDELQAVYYVKEDRLITL
ncbi:MAG: hypothetical protein ACK4UP_04035 [Spirosomataceae bacterium]